MFQLGNEKRVNYKQLHFSWVTGAMFIQGKQAWAVQSFYKQYFKQKYKTKVICF